MNGWAKAVGHASKSLWAKNSLWVLPRVPNPCLIDHGSIRPKIVQRPGSTVYLVSPRFEPRAQAFHMGRRRLLSVSPIRRR